MLAVVMLSVVVHSVIRLSVVTTVLHLSKIMAYMKIKVKIRDSTDTLKCYDDRYVIILFLRLLAFFSLPMPLAGAGIKPLTRQLFNHCATTIGQL